MKRPVITITNREDKEDYIIFNVSINGILCLNAELCLNKHRIRDIEGSYVPVSDTPEVKAEIKTLKEWVKVLNNAVSRDGFTLDIDDYFYSRLTSPAELILLELECEKL